MIKRIKRMPKVKNDRGSSFVLVIVATTFLCVLASALLLGALMTYKLKYYKLNSLNNFYEVETALDEIYAGVGASTNEHLYEAYTTTAELVVYYDTNEKKYANLSNDKANSLFKELFMTGFVSDSGYNTYGSLKATLESFVSNAWSTSNPDGIQIDTSKLQLIYTDTSGNQQVQTATGTKTAGTGIFDSKKIDSITFKNICVKREIEITKGTSTGNYVQSITTDLVLTEPQYNVSFDLANQTSSNLYSYAILADMGIEIGGNDAATKESPIEVDIKGNIYTASDYYNKDYNGDVATKVTNKYEDETGILRGMTDNSLYSGLYVYGNTDLTLNSDIIVCSGALTAYNGASINMLGRSQNITELWTDNIVIGGSEDGSMTIAADAYVYDDTELNAENSSLVFTQGRYFGYSYNANDTRSISYIKEKGLASNFSLRSHFNDSAIIVNGKNSELNLSSLSSLYIAGKSYIEFSKLAASSVQDKYKYTSDKVTTDEDGNVTSDTRDEDQKSEYGVVVDNNSDYTYTSLTDYSTGQSLDVKTNQLIFLAQWEEVENSYDETTGTVKLKIPSWVTSDSSLKSLYDSLKQNATDDNLLAVKQSVSGHDYYYLYIKDGETNGISNAERFAEEYYRVLTESNNKQTTSRMYNVADYENFEVKLVLPNDSSINANSAVTKQNSDGSLYLQASVDANVSRLDVDAALTNASSGRIFGTLLGGSTDEINATTYSDIKTEAAKMSGMGTASTEQTVSNLLSYMYINMKDHLALTDKEVVQTPAGTDADGNPIKETKVKKNAWELVGYTNTSSGYTGTDGEGKTTYNYSLTPLNYFVNFEALYTNAAKQTSGSSLYKDKVEINEKVGEATVIINSGDVKISGTATDSSFEGIVIAAGNVTIDPTITSFRGMIITGAKLYVSDDLTITADASYVMTVLKKCAESTDKDVNALATVMLKNYMSESSESDSSVSGVSISDISYDDILVFRNWKKNVE